MSNVLMRCLGDKLAVLALHIHALYTRIVKLISLYLHRTEGVSPNCEMHCVCVLFRITQ